MSHALTDPLDFSSEVPVYEQIATRLKFAIARRAFGDEGQLPSVRALARALIVNPNTVIRVYRELELERLIVTHPGRAAVVAPGAEEKCGRKRVAIVEERLREGIGLARRASFGDSELDGLWTRLRKEEERAS